jgi:hypothetical protein
MAFIMIQFNHQWEFLPLCRYFLPVIRIDCRNIPFKCKETNTVRMIIQNPRVNIDLLYAMYEFYFESWPVTPGKMGQVLFPLQCMYTIHTNNPVFHNLNNVDMGDCPRRFPAGEIPIHGTMTLYEDQVQEIFIPVPTLCNTLQREIVLSHKPRRRGECVICSETEVEIYNVHSTSEYAHEFCMPCLLQIVPVDTIFPRIVPCPLCRQNIVSPNHELVSDDLTSVNS